MQNATIERRLITHLNNVHADTTGLIETRLTWTPEDPNVLTAAFWSGEPGGEISTDVKTWVVGVELLRDAIVYGDQSSAEGRCVMAIVEGQDIRLTLVEHVKAADARSWRASKVSIVTWDLEQIQEVLDKVAELLAK